MTCSFKYVPVRLGQECAVSMWTLSLSDKEWGGQLIPKHSGDDCILSRGTKLIVGTELVENENDRFYLGDNLKQQKVKIAVTPFYKEVFQVHQLCDTGDSVNIFFHSHPLFIDNSIGIPLPPSIGDFFAHGLLSNYRNFRENNQLNTAIVSAFEGLYVYFPLPHKFMLFRQQVDELWNALPSKTKHERTEFELGELPQRLVDVVKMETFNTLRSAFDSFLIEYSQLVTPESVSTIGAPVLNNSMWKKHDILRIPTFPYGSFAQSEECINFIRNNSYIRALNLNGFHYEFFPAPYTTDIRFLALMRHNCNVV